MSEPEKLARSGPSPDPKRLGSGIASEFESFYRAHAGRVLAYALRRTSWAMAEEVVSETFLAAWRRFESVPKDPVPWLLATAANVLRNQMRSASRLHALEARLGNVPTNPDTPSWDGAETSVPQLLVDLSPRDREAIRLLYWDELTMAEAARVLGCSRGSLSVRMFRVRRKLRDALASESTNLMTGRQLTRREADQ
jgi:RNA polymerase sigma-70 factor (ECF subfamily)